MSHSSRRTQAPFLNERERKREMLSLTKLKDTARDSRRPLAFLLQLVIAGSESGMFCHAAFYRKPRDKSDNDLAVIDLSNSIVNSSGYADVCRPHILLSPSKVLTADSQTVQPSTRVREGGVGRNITAAAICGVQKDYYLLLLPRQPLEKSVAHQKAERRHVETFCSHKAFAPYWLSAWRQNGGPLSPLLFSSNFHSAYHRFRSLPEKTRHPANPTVCGRESEDGKKKLVCFEWLEFRTEHDQPELISDFLSRCYSPPTHPPKPFPSLLLPPLNQESHTLSVFRCSSPFQKSFQPRNQPVILKEALVPY